MSGDASKIAQSMAWESQNLGLIYIQGNAQISFDEFMHL